jgi:ABC-type branched-subunit amino acid transport system ATPase component/ABC-type branched-subunit amino acid transport system permease subunit
VSAFLVPSLLPLFGFTAPGGVVLQGAMLGTGTGLLAVGLVLVYRSTRIVNFAYGAMGGFGAAVGFSLYLGHGWPWPLAVLVATLVGIATGVGIELIVIRRFRSASRLTLTVATIGLAQVLGGMELLVPRVLGGPQIVGAFDTSLNATRVTVDPVIITGNSLLLVAVVPVLLGALSWFLLRTDAGIAVRGIADNVERARLLGIPADQLSTIVWSVAGALASLTVVLKAPAEGLILDAGAGPQLLLPALTAAVVAGMEDLRKAFLAGVALGVIDQVVRWNVDKQSASTVVFLAVILVALAVSRRGTGRGADRTGDDDDWATTSRLRLPAWLADLPQARRSKRAGLVLAVGFAIALPYAASPSQLNRLSSAVIFGIVALSLVLLTGWSGSVSLGQMAIAGAGGLVAAILVSRWNVDLFVTLAAAGIAGAVAALLLGLPALRVKGMYLAVTTLAFAVAIDSFVLNSVNFRDLIPDSFDRPMLWGRFDLKSESVLYETCLFVLLLAVLVLWGVRGARPGRAMLAGRDNSRAASSAGIAPRRTKLMAFTLSGMLAGVAGALNAVLLGGVGYHTYEPSQSLLVFSMAVIGGVESLGGALLGVALIELASFLVPALQLIISGALLLIILLVVPRGLGEVARRVGIRMLAFVARARGIEAPAAAADGSAVIDLDGAPAPAGTRLGRQLERTGGELPVPAAAWPLLSCRGVTASYGPMQVLFGVDLDVQPGEMVALLGTNGAGKSTVLRAVTGLLRPDGGSVHLDGVDLSRLPTDQIAQRGVALMPGGRGLFGGLTVAENLRLATWLCRTDRDAVAEAERRTIELFPVLGERLDLKAGQLSGGEQQMLSLAMALATNPKVLCIDELSLGLAPTVVADLVQLVRRIHASGTTVIVVEQSVNVALLLCERAVFLEKGAVRFEGPTRDLLDRPDVLRAVFVGEATTTGHGTDRSQSAAATSAVRSATTMDAARGATLECRDLVKRYGGINAVDDLSLTIDAGAVVGIIGHNGAGKTTLFDLLSGFAAPERGRVRLGGNDITDAPPHRRAIAGLGRSFQEARLYPSLTVAETIAVALDRHLLSREPLAAGLHLKLSVASEAEAFARVDEIVALLGLTRYRSHLTAELSTGTRRIVELACILAQAPSVVLLDEPTAGVAQRDTEALGPLLTRVHQQTGCTMVVIEHDMTLLSGLCDELIALELGRVIARGTPASVLDHPHVVASYLGTDAATIARSDPALVNANL